LKRFWVVGAVLLFVVVAFGVGFFLDQQGKSPKPPEGKPVVVIETSMGPIKVELYPDKAPITVKNFLDYVDDKFYDGTLFHRVIRDFMIQGGGYLPGLKDIQAPQEMGSLKKKGRAPIRNEAANGLRNQRGTIAMAQSPGNPDSATTEFFINVVDNSNLDRARGNPGYCVFGKVIEGMEDVVDKIKEVPTKVVIPPDVLKDVPVEDVVIKSIRRADK
jgi:cyclophilin family peptidyl-prolyl cis-trans isomerase